MVASSFCDDRKSAFTAMSVETAPVVTDFNHDRHVRDFTVLFKKKQLSTLSYVSIISAQLLKELFRPGLFRFRPVIT